MARRALEAVAATHEGVSSTAISNRQTSSSSRTGASRSTMSAARIRPTPLRAWPRTTRSWVSSHTCRRRGARPSRWTPAASSTPSAASSAHSSPARHPSRESVFRPLFTLNDLKAPMADDYAEHDFEYLPNGGRSAPSKRADPAAEQLSESRQSYAGRHHPVDNNSSSKFYLDVIYRSITREGTASPSRSTGPEHCSAAAWCPSAGRAQHAVAVAVAVAEQNLALPAGTRAPDSRRRAADGQGRPPFERWSRSARGQPANTRPALFVRPALSAYGEVTPMMLRAWSRRDCASLCSRATAALQMR